MSEITSLKKIEMSAAAVLKRNTDAKRQAYELFNTTQGQVVYQWLMKQFYHNQHVATEEAKLSRHAGRRDVMVLLRGIVEKEQ